MLSSKRSNLKRKGLNLYTKIPWFDNVEIVKMILSCVQDDNIVLDKPYPILKEVISLVTGLCNSGEVLIKKSILNREVEALSSMKGDQRAFIINTIINLVVRYTAYDISYKIYFKNREGTTSTIAVYMAHMLAMKNMSFDLCELLRELLLKNVKMTKEKNYPF